MRLDIKPLTVNRAWQGRRFKTKEYKAYEQEVLCKLRPLTVPEGYLELAITFGFSNKASDFDNPLKPFLDCLQKKYGFNDKVIKRATINVEHVNKGEEFIEFDLHRIGHG